MTKRATIEAPPDAYQVASLMHMGVSKNRLRANDIRRVARGIVLHPETQLDPGKDRDRCLAVGRSLKEGHFLSRRSAALVYCIPSPRPQGHKVDVGSFWPMRSPRRTYIAGHRVKRNVLEWAEIDGVRIPSPADVWCQLAAVSTLTQMVQAGDFIISGKRIVNGGGRRDPPLADIDALSAAAARHLGTLGSKLREQALPMLRTAVDSPTESAVRVLVVGAGFPEPMTNCPVQVADRLLHADMGYPELKIAIEYEGLQHFMDPKEIRHDEIRRAKLEDAGWRVLRVMNDDLLDPSYFLQQLAKAFRGALVGVK